MNTKNLGNLQKEMLSFLRKYPGWVTFRPDPTTKRVALSLLKRGLVKMNAHGQVKLIS